MGSRLDFDATNKIVLLSVVGVLTDKTLFDGYATFKKFCQRYGSSWNCIVDYTRLTKVAITSNGIRHLANKPPIFAMDCVVLNVAPENAMFGMARMFQILSSDARPNFQVVHTMDEALKRIGVQSPNFAPVEDDFREAA